MVKNLTCPPPLKKALSSSLDIWKLLQDGGILNTIIEESKSLEFYHFYWRQPLEFQWVLVKGAYEERKRIIWDVH